jgi:2-polyprenyl-6-methoxyphenol hydroxylase-like FAD-dependent oxidoreductase
MTAPKIYDVIIAGAGPVGLFLACELGLARLSVLVLERDLELSSPAKRMPLGRRGLCNSSIETLYRRGLADQLLDPSAGSLAPKKPGFQVGGIFAGIMLNSDGLDWSRWMYRLPGTTTPLTGTRIDHLEAVLSQRAQDVGVTVLRGTPVTKITDRGSSVAVEAGDASSQTYVAKWLVGCDGGRSMVRKSVGIDFHGTGAKFTGYALQCDLDHPEKLKPGFHVTESGMYIKAPDSLYLVDFDDAAFDRRQDITQEHAQTILHRVTGIQGLNITALQLAASSTDRAKQASTYRKGRVLLAGDAAHIHGPVGGQGLNVGLGDAMNLGWKLAATVRHENEHGEVPTDLRLLDTYHDERHPIGTWLLEWTRAQVSIMQPNPFSQAMRKIVTDLTKTADGKHHFIDQIWGLSQRYQLQDEDSDAHPLVGCSAPDFEFVDGSRLGERLRSGHGLFVDFNAELKLKDDLDAGGLDRGFEYVGMCATEQLGLRCLLVRPDGIVAWASEAQTQSDAESVRDAVRRWS